MMPDKTKPFQIESDASKYATGAVLGDTQPSPQLLLPTYPRIVLPADPQTRGRTLPMLSHRGVTTRSSDSGLSNPRIREPADPRMTCTLSLISFDVDLCLLFIRSIICFIFYLFIMTPFLFIISATSVLYLYTLTLAGIPIFSSSDPLLGES